MKSSRKPLFRMGTPFVRCVWFQHAVNKNDSCNSLVNIGCGPIEELARKSVEACCRVFEVRCCPDGSGIGPSFVYSKVAIVTIVITRKGDVVRVDVISFNDDLQCGVVRPTCRSQHCAMKFDTSAAPKDLLRPKKPAMKYSALFNILLKSQHYPFEAKTLSTRRPEGALKAFRSRGVSRHSKSGPDQGLCCENNIPILSGRSSYDFGRSIIEVSVIIVVEHARVEEFLLPDRDQDLISEAVAERIQESKLSREVCGSVRSLRDFRVSDPS